MWSLVTLLAAITRVKINRKIIFWTSWNFSSILALPYLNLTPGDSGSPLDHLEPFDSQRIAAKLKLLDGKNSVLWNPSADGGKYKELISKLKNDYGIQVGDDGFILGRSEVGPSGEPNPNVNILVKHQDGPKSYRANIPKIVDSARWKEFPLFPRHVSLSEPDVFEFFKLIVQFWIWHKKCHRKRELNKNPEIYGTKKQLEAASNDNRQPGAASGLSSSSAMSGVSPGTSGASSGSSRDPIGKVNNQTLQQFLGASRSSLEASQASLTASQASLTASPTLAIPPTLTNSINHE